MSFLTDYLHATEGNESPKAYHLWSCLSALSVCAGRRFWFKLGHLTFYPNLYVLLVGEPGVKKSTAMNKAKDIIRESGVAPIAASQATKEFFGRAMSSDKFAGKDFFEFNGTKTEYNQYAIFATEFTQFIAVNPEGMLEFLTAVYDEKVHAVDTKNQGSDYVIGPYITLLGCLTPHMLKGYLKMNVLTGGFARRTVFVYGFEEAIVAIPTYTPSQIAASDRCIEYAKALHHRCGEFTFGPGAEEWYVSWYTNLRKSIKDIAKPSTEGYYRSKHELLFKVAMLLALGQDCKDLVLLPHHFEIAEKYYFSHVDKHLERVFEGTGVNPNAEVSSQICRMLEALGKPMNEKVLKRDFGSNATSWRDLDDTINYQVTVGRLERRMVTDASGNLAGTLIGTPESFLRLSPVALSACLVVPARPSNGTSMDSQT